MPMSYRLSKLITTSLLALRVVSVLALRGLLAWALLAGLARMLPIVPVTLWQACLLVLMLSFISVLADEVSDRAWALLARRWLAHLRHLAH